MPKQNHPGSRHNEFGAAFDAPLIGDVRASDPARPPARPALHALPPRTQADQESFCPPHTDELRR